MDILLMAQAGLCREGIVRLLREFATGVEVRVTDELCADWPGERAPGCVIIDGAMLRHDRADVELLRACARATPVVVLLPEATQAVVDQLVATGVSGCVEKSASVELFFGALRLALAGGVYLPRSLVSAGLHDPSARRDGPALPGAPDVAVRLTPRQIEVLALVARGRSNKVIARQLDMAEATVKTHLTTIYKALNVTSRGEASAVAARLESIREAQASKAVNGPVPVARFLANVQSRHFRPGEILFRKGDPGGALFYVEHGTIRLSDLGIELGAGAVLGEIGLFSPDHRRTSTAICKTACELRTVSAAEAIRIYYQEPDFALYMIQLVASRLQATPQTACYSTSQ